MCRTSQGFFIMASMDVNGGDKIGGSAAPHRSISGRGHKIPPETHSETGNTCPVGPPPVLVDTTTWQIPYRSV